MRCGKCEDDAIIELRQHNIAFCRDHYDEFFRVRVEKAIKNFNLFKNDAKILIAISGGKDSLALWDVLFRLGYETKGVIIDLGIPQYSEQSVELSKKFAEEKSLDLHIIKLEDEFAGNNILKIAREVHRTNCSVCGLVKRYLLNKYAYESGYGVICTGHNLDDEAALLFGNVLGWKLEYMKKQFPKLEKNIDKLVDKAKPLIYLTDREVAVYNLINKIEYIDYECPLSKGANSRKYKHALSTLEEIMSGSKQRFLFDFYRNKSKIFFEEKDEYIDERSCKICGYPTTQDVCNYCRIKEKVLSDNE
ncbi:MAG: tRNA-5-methyluridine54 2-sulfurtransferase [Kosmotogales bacterium]|nr:tRNA-5-methyluridine54 2-sulfurtransferase [Kosmotogales bacterium]